MSYVTLLPDNYPIRNCHCRRSRFESNRRLSGYTAYASICNVRFSILTIFDSGPGSLALPSIQIDFKQEKDSGHNIKNSAYDKFKSLIQASYSSIKTL
ncbi:10537_t:CDS:2 [Scutellospora calospora]|uniref:8255_t:CDS:1 n=2 Tax=Scutellospora calospora TaxID=85575 RepID=A0ACA9JTQ3_9GLOM|nr:8255_t:CDS:2 [Scutellospora calospora]CAG8434162.1 10537_t:CDS:2 [Scutellospora calospora]